MPEISGSSHSSKKTRGRDGKRGGRCPNGVEPGVSERSQRLGLGLAADHAAEHADHLQDPAIDRWLKAQTV